MWQIRQQRCSTISFTVHLQGSTRVRKGGMDWEKPKNVVNPLNPIINLLHLGMGFTSHLQGDYGICTQSPQRPITNSSPISSKHQKDKEISYDNFSRMFYFSLWGLTKKTIIIYTCIIFLWRTGYCFSSEVHGYFESPFTHRLWCETRSPSHVRIFGTWDHHGRPR